MQSKALGIFVVIGFAIIKNTLYDCSNGALYRKNPTRSKKEKCGFLTYPGTFSDQSARNVSGTPALNVPALLRSNSLFIWVLLGLPSVSTL